MEKYTFNSNNLKGDIKVPPSKSMAHRAIICASLANGKSVVTNINYSEDINATIEMCEAIGASIIKREDSLVINGRISNKHNFGNCRESGSTLRFFIPIVKYFYEEFNILGAKSLLSRPLNEYHRIFPNDIINNEESLVIKGGINANNYQINGNISSQFISGLLFVLPLCKTNSIIEIIGKIESKSYILMTIEVLKHFGINIDFNDNIINIKGSQSYIPYDYEVEGDYSQAAFYYVANGLGAKVNLKGLNEDSLQGDRIIKDLVNNPPEIIDGHDCPDIIPVLAVYLALQPQKTTEIINIGRLRYKESDRINSTVALIRNLGGIIEENTDSIKIIGIDSFKGGIIDSYNDHRIAMSAAIASLKTLGEITLINPMCVNKSYPAFFDDFKQLGGVFNGE